MGPNKFASMVHRNTNRLTLVLVYVLLEWILIAMVLLNSLFSYLIIKYSDFFGLKRPCVLCSRIDHGSDKSIRKDMICDEHGLEISELVFCQRHGTLVTCGQTNSMCKNCCPLPKPTSFDLTCSCCEERLEDNPAVHFFDVAGVDAEQANQSTKQEMEEKAEEEDRQQLVPVEFVVPEDDDEDMLESLVTEIHQDMESDHESESFKYPDKTNEIEQQNQNSNGNEAESEIEAMLEFEHQEVGLCVLNNSSELASIVEKLTKDLNEAYAELEQEKTGAAEASSKTMAMITMLQEEKSALQLEASQYQRTTEKQSTSDQEENDLTSDQEENDLSAASTIEKLTRELNEAYAELEQERNDALEASCQTMAMITRLQEEKAALQLEASQYKRMADEQIAFDEEAVLLLDELVRRREKENHELEKELDLYRKRFAEKHEKMVVIGNESVSVCCSSFGDQYSDGVSTEDYEHHQELQCDYSLVDLEDEKLSILDRLNELEEKLVEVSKGEESFVEDEIEDDDKEFLRKCIKSVKKGDEGMSLVLEILQHLRALRRLEIS